VVPTPLASKNGFDRHAQRIVDSFSGGPQTRNTRAHCADAGVATTRQRCNRGDGSPQQLMGVPALNQKGNRGGKT